MPANPTHDHEPDANRVGSAAESPAEQKALQHIGHDGHSGPDSPQQHQGGIGMEHESDGSRPDGSF